MSEREAELLRAVARLAVALRQSMLLFDQVNQPLVAEYCGKELHEARCALHRAGVSLSTEVQHVSRNV